MKPTQMCAPLKSFSNSEHLVCFKIQSFKYVSSQHRTHLLTIAKISLLHRFQKLVGVDLELRKLEGAVEAIHENFLYLKSREADMREVSETTNARVAWFSIMSLGLCICVSALQLWHLKRFFRKKKLI